MKTILEHLSRFDTEGYTEPPPLETPALPPTPPRSRVLYNDMRPGQYGYSAETSQRPIVRRCVETLPRASAYRGRSFWVDTEDSVPELSAAPASSLDSVPPYSSPPPLWYDPSMWPDEPGPSVNLNEVYVRLVAAANANPPLASFIPGQSCGNPTPWMWVNHPPTPEPNAQS